MIAPGALLLWTLLAASPASPATDDAPSPEDSAFAAALRAKATQEGGWIDGALQGDLDGDGTPDEVVCVASQELAQLTFVRLSSGRLYRFVEEQWNGCPKLKAHGTRTLLVLRQPRPSGEETTRRVLFDGKGPLLAGTSASSRYGAEDVDLLRGYWREVDHSWMWDTSNDGGPACETDNCDRLLESAVIVAGASIPKAAAPTWVSYGRRH